MAEIKIKRIFMAENINGSINIKGKNKSNTQGVFQQKLGKPEGSGTIYLKWLKGKSYNHKYSTQQDFPSDLMEI